MIFWIINKIIAAYILSTSAFLLIILFNKASRKRQNIFLHKSNLIIVVVLFVNIIWAGVEMIKCKTEQIKNLAGNTQNNFMNYNQHCISIFIITLLLAFLFQSFFIVNKYRKKISLTVMSIFLLAVYNNFERVVVFITHFFRDYTPSSWAIYYDNENQIWIVAFSIAYFIICWTNKPTIMFYKQFIFNKLK
jgi:hypothetical protein